MDNMIINRVGEKYTTNEGYEIEIIEYFNSENCTVKFEDGKVYKNIIFKHIKNGNIKNPYHRSVRNIGYLGEGKFRVSINKSDTNYYLYWISMLSRCSGEINLPTYKDVTVCDNWHNFQNFAKWFEYNWKPYMDGWQLDKDILVKGNKIYNSETCCFVPSEVNSLFIKANKSRGKYPIGVTFNKRLNKFVSQISINHTKVHLGVFDTIEEAFNAYKTAKEEYIKEVADKWRDQISEEVYQAMYAYQVEITD